MSVIRRATVAHILACLAGLAALPAAAHVTFETAEVRADATVKFVARVPHGCSGEATHTVQIDLPAGLLDAKPMPKAGWTLTTQRAPFERAYKLYGKDVTEGVRRITWSSGSLEDGHYDEFVFRARVDGSLAGTTLTIPVTQLCATGQAAWVERPAAGQDAHALKFPAPTVRVSQTSASAGQVKAGSLSIAQPWAPATPGAAKVAGGYVTIVNTGEADRLIGGTFAEAGRVEIHEMSNTGGVMRMRELERGLPIEARATTELKPGGFHMMFMDLKRPLKAGETVAGTLVFEKAGSVPVTFEVRPLGSNAGGGHHHH